jgi:hypothetical protein
MDLRAEMMSRAHCLSRNAIEKLKNWNSMGI